MPFRPALRRRSMSRVLIFSLLGLLLSALAVKRAVERTPIQKETAGFKFSKILELPHKKNAGSTVVAVSPTELLTVDAEMIEYPVPPDVPSVSYDPARLPTSSRAPPLASAL